MCYELENSGIRVAVGDCSVTERRRLRPPYQTGKTVHVHATTTNTTRTDAVTKASLTKCDIHQGIVVIYIYCMFHDISFVA